MDERITDYFADKLSREERITLLEEIKNDEELGKEFAAYRNTGALLALSNRVGDKETGERSYGFFRNRLGAARRKKRTSGFLKYAAAALLLIAGSWITSHYYHIYSYGDSLSFNEITVPPGQHTNVRLSDGTEVWMNARSSMRYPSHFSRKERKIELKGEAFFNVACNEKAPFIVSTSTIDIKVLGTSFNVKESVSDLSVDVTLLKGSVEVVPDNAASERIRLKPMQKLNYNNGAARIIQVHNEDDLLWKQGILFFNKLPLSEIAGRIEWYYDTRVVINNKEIGGHIYSGKFRQQDGPYEILRILQKSQKFEFRKDDVNNVFILDKPR